MRKSVAAMLGAVGLVALGLGALRAATPALADAGLYLVYGVLVVAAIGAAARGGRDGSWAGFAVAGWAYFLPVFVLGSPERVRDLPTSRLLVAYATRATPWPSAPAGYGLTLREHEPVLTWVHLRPPQSPPEGFRLAVSAFNARLASSVAVGHLLLVLVLGALGAVLGRHLARRPVGPLPSSG